MAGMYTTTPEQMRLAAIQVRQTDERIQARLAQLRSEVQTVAGQWQGEAATAFQALMQRWDADSTRLNQALRGIGETIEVSGRGYQQAEEQHAHGMSQITSALG